MLRLTAVEELEHIAPALDAAIGRGCAPRAEAEEGLKSRHRLSPAIVAEHELIEVRLELGTADAMMGTNQPVLEVTDDAIGERHDRGRALAQRRPQRLFKRDVAIPSSLQAAECPETVGVNRRIGGDVLLDNGAHRRRREIWQNDEADAARTVVTLLDGH